MRNFLSRISRRYINENPSSFINSIPMISNNNNSHIIREPLLNDMNIDMNNNWSDWNVIRNEINKSLLYYIKDWIKYKKTITTNPIIINEVLPRTEYMLIKTNLNGKNNRGVLCFDALKELKKDNFNDIDIHNGLTIACCIEALQSYFLVMDDIMDQSHTRRGQLCWYKYPNVGLKAVNDGPVIESFVFWLIQNRLIPISDTNGTSYPCKQQILLDYLFRDIIDKTQMGQMMDLELTKDSSNIKDIYTMDRYNTIAMYKTSYYTFYLPYASAMYLSGYDNKINVKKRDNSNYDDTYLFNIIQQISMEMGIKFQVHDDYLDCFGDPKITGKIGTDIQDFKCSWLFVIALNVCNEDELNTLMAHYGKDNENDIKIVKELYQELNLIDIYKRWEQMSADKIHSMINESQHLLPSEMFLKIMQKLHNRNK